MQIIFGILLFATWGYIQTILMQLSLHECSQQSPSSLVTISILNNSTTVYNYNTKSQPHKVAILIPWKGKFPVWINFYLESLRINDPIYNFIFILNGDDKDSISSIPDLLKVPNVHFYIFEKGSTWEEWVSHQIHDYAGIESSQSRAYFQNNLKKLSYNVCRFRPMFGVIFKDILQNYTHWGWTDMDIIFGILFFIINFHLFLSFLLFYFFIFI